MATKKLKLTDLVPDARNANKGTARGLSVLEDSLQQLGAGRSILVDKNGAVIAGNKTLETASAAGFQDVLVVETDGKQLVAVKRTDLDLSSDPLARKLAYADNRAGEIGLEWDPEVIAADMLEIDEIPGFTADELTALVGRYTESEQPESAGDGEISAKLTIPPRAWLTDRPEVESVVTRACEQFGISIKWPD